MKGWKEASELDEKAPNTATWRKRSQELCDSGIEAEDSLVWCKYGGHYFSPTQAFAFDAMLKTLKAWRKRLLSRNNHCSSCALASPGHTAQPFKATRTAGRYLREAWKRDPFAYARQAVAELCPLHAKHLGKQHVADANEAAKTLSAGGISSFLTRHILAYITVASTMYLRRLPEANAAMSMASGDIRQQKSGLIRRTAGGTDRVTR